MHKVPPLTLELTRTKRCGLSAEKIKNICEKKSKKKLNSACKIEKMIRITKKKKKKKKLCQKKVKKLFG